MCCFTARVVSHSFCKVLNDKSIFYTVFIWLKAVCWSHFLLPTVPRLSQPQAVFEWKVDFHRILRILRVPLCTSQLLVLFVWLILFSLSIHEIITFSLYLNVINVQGWWQWTSDKLKKLQWIFRFYHYPIAKKINK